MGFFQRKKTLDLIFQPPLFLEQGRQGLGIVPGPWLRKFTLNVCKALLGGSRVKAAPREC